MHSIWFGEFMGTLVLLLLGDGVNAGVTLRKSYAANAGWLAVTVGWALAVLCGVMVAQAFGSPGANMHRIGSSRPIPRPSWASFAPTERCATRRLIF
ncbi:MAG: hypothetical protein ABSF16_10805 [Terracidiphilus sp.]